MAPRRKNKGKAPAGDEEESSQRNVRGANAYISPPPDPSVRPVLRLGGHRTFDAGHPELTKQVAKIISQLIRTAYPGPYTRYTDFPNDNKLVIQADFLKHYQFSLEVPDSIAWDVFRKIADKRLQDMLNKARDAAIKSYGEELLEWKERGVAPRPHDSWIKPEFWPGLVDHWCSDAFARRSQRNALNRANAEGSGATTGSVNMLVHKQRFEQEKGREPRWSDELFQPTHTKKKTGEYITGKAKEAQEKYESAMVQKYGEDRNTWPAYDGDVWYSTGISDQNAHGDNYGLGALGKTRRMFRSSGSSSQSHSSQSYSSMPPAPQFTAEHIDMISTQVLDRMEDRLAVRDARLLDSMEDRFMSRITDLFRASQGGSGSLHSSRPAPRDDEDDDEGQGSDVGGDGTS